MTVVSTDEKFHLDVPDLRLEDCELLDAEGGCRCEEPYELVREVSED